MMRLERVENVIGSRRSEQLKVFLGVTGASGIVLALRLADVLKSLDMYIVTVYTANSLTVAEGECISSEWFLSKLKELSDEIYDEKQIDAPPSSSSNVLDVYLIVPASVKTMAMIVNGIASNLLIRAVLNGLRMRKPVVAVVREAPLGVVELKVLYRASRVGISIIPAVVGFYACPQDIKEVIDFVVGKVLDFLGIEHNLYRRWKKARDPSIRDPCQILYGSKES